MSALEQLSDAERGRFRMWQIAQQTHWDNMHYQYQQGYLDQEYYDDARSFFAEIDRLSRE